MKNKFGGRCLHCGSLNWEHDDDPSDIIAYRIVRK